MAAQRDAFFASYQALPEESKRRTLTRATSSLCRVVVPVSVAAFDGVPGYEGEAEGEGETGGEAEGGARDFVPGFRPTCFCFPSLTGPPCCR